MLRGFLFKIFSVAWLVALVTTGIFWARSFRALDEWHGWKYYGQSGLVHLYIQSNFGRVEIYGSRVERVDAYNRPMSWPKDLLPTYPPTEYRSLSPTRPEWGYADSFVPTPEANHDFNWAEETRSEPAEDTSKSYGYKTPSYLNPTATRREHRWMFAFPYGFLAIVFATPLALGVLMRAARKKPAPASAAAQAVARR